MQEIGYVSVIRSVEGPRMDVESHPTHGVYDRDSLRMDKRGVESDKSRRL